jgi:predicted amidohydrolase/ribosomal protein S18 acetylase RimI-like enzyme
MARAINLKRFEKKIVVRQLRPEDWESVVALQQRCFPGMETWTQDEFTSQLSTFPEGQIGVEYQGKLVASSSSLILDFEEYKEWDTLDAISDFGRIRNHTQTGSTLYGIEMMVDPQYRRLRLATRLYDARKRLARERNLMRIVIGGRIPGYAKHANEMSAREYIEKVMSKTLEDPVLSAQLANGFVLKRLIPGYLTMDVESRGYAAFLEWSNVDYVPHPVQRFVPTSPVRVCVVQFQMRQIASFDEFASQCEYFVDVASEYHCDFILFPEVFTLQLMSLITEENPAAAVRRLSDYTDQYLEHFTRLAVGYNINIVGGSHFTVEEDDLYNISFLFRRDGTLGKQYKLHITPTERHAWGVTGGKSVEVFDTDRGKIAIQICYDIEFPELTRIAVDKGAQIIFVPFSTDERYAYLRVRYCAQARCIENHVYVAVAGSVGNLPNVDNLGLHYAQSGIFTPADIPFKRDAVAAECTPNIETVIFEDLDLDLLKRHRQSGSVLNWRDRRTDLYEVRYLQEPFAPQPLLPFAGAPAPPAPAAAAEPRPSPPDSRVEDHPVESPVENR